MKIRDGFVSNSSSSSFVVCFHKRPKSRDELKKMLFGDEIGFPNPYPYGEDSTRVFPADVVAERVWNDLKTQKRPLSEKKMVEEVGLYMYGEWVAKYIQSSPMPEEPDYDFWKYLTEDERKLSYSEQQKLKPVKDYNASREKWQKAFDKWSEKMVATFIKQNPGKYFRFHYSDNGEGELGSAMEHGDLFHKLPHFRISHH